MSAVVGSSPTPAGFASKRKEMATSWPADRVISSSRGTIRAAVIPTVLLLEIFKVTDLDPLLVRRTRRSSV